MDTDRVLGRLEEFKEWAGQEFVDIKSEFKEVKADLKSLQHFRMKIAGAALIVATITSLVMEMVRH